MMSGVVDQHFAHFILFYYTGIPVVYLLIDWEPHYKNNLT